jgi:hypothetical protein
MPILLAAMAAIGAFGGLALAQDPQSSGIQATAEQIDCSAFDMTAAQEREVEDCWNTELVSPPPTGATEVEIALAEQAALCDAVDAIDVRPDFCSISHAAAAEGTTSTTTP